MAKLLRRHRTKRSTWARQRPLLLVKYVWQVMLNKMHYVIVLLRAFPFKGISGATQGKTCRFTNEKDTYRTNMAWVPRTTGAHSSYSEYHRDMLGTLHGHVSIFPMLTFLLPQVVTRLLVNSRFKIGWFRAHFIVGYP